MKIKVVDMPYEQALAQPREKHTPPRRPSMLFRALLRALSAPDLRATHFRCDRVGMERLGPDEPCLVLMNHSCFLDLKIAAAVLYPRPFNIVCTSDGFVGKAGLMRALGCIPTRTFQPDTALVRDMLYAVKKLKSSILLYPEASYSFDGTATPLPESLGKCVKALGVPVVLLRTCGAFARDPLYNGLQNRRVDVSAELRYLLSPEEAAEKSADEINALLADEFSFDNFRWQQENGVVVNEPFRADGLNRVLYKCPHCGTEGAGRAGMRKRRGEIHPCSRLVCVGTRVRARGAGAGQLSARRSGEHLRDGQLPADLPRRRGPPAPRCERLPPHGLRRKTGLHAEARDQLQSLRRLLLV